MLCVVVDLPFGENMSLSNTVKSTVSSIFVTMNSICIKKWATLSFSKILTKFFQNHKKLLKFLFKIVKKFFKI